MAGNAVRAVFFLHHGTAPNWCGNLRISPAYTGTCFVFCLLSVKYIREYILNSVPNGLPSFIVCGFSPQYASLPEISYFLYCLFIKNCHFSGLDFGFRIVYTFKNVYNRRETVKPVDLQIDLDVRIMKIEKLNDNQIRCTLTRDDLANRQIKLSELAYGTEKAKELFRDMMQQAAIEFGFEADNIPLMIEAIPLPNECIVLIITKVEDPEELDTRFAKFAPGGDNTPEDVNDLNGILPEGADNVLDMFRKLIDRQLKESAAHDAEPKKAVTLANELDISRIYSFPDLDTVIHAAHVLKGCYHGFNSLYRLSRDGDYCLVIRKSSHTPEEFNKFSNILSEYGNSEKYSSAGEAYLEEHEELMIAGEALQKLAGL